MVSVAVSKLECSSLAFVGPGAKVNGTYYCDELLSEQLLPDICHIAGDTFVFQQDSAAAHRARATPYFIGPDLWPPNSPDLNPVDFKLWGVMQERVCQTPIHDIDDLKTRPIAAWSGIHQQVIDETIDQWRKRLQAYVKAGRRHFEHLIRLSLMCFIPHFNIFKLLVVNLSYAFAMLRLSTLIVGLLY